MSVVVSLYSNKNDEIYRFLNSYNKEIINNKKDVFELKLLILLEFLQIIMKNMILICGLV